MSEETRDPDKPHTHKCVNTHRHTHPSENHSKWGEEVEVKVHLRWASKAKKQQQQQQLQMQPHHHFGPHSNRIFLFFEHVSHIGVSFADGVGYVGIHVRLWWCRIIEF